ncbi:unnamed protein product, partial [Discosporangium mesarthrocarpum]
ANPRHSVNAVGLIAALILRLVLASKTLVPVGTSSPPPQSVVCNVSSTGRNNAWVVSLPSPHLSTQRSRADEKDLTQCSPTLTLTHDMPHSHAGEGGRCWGGGR